MFCKNCGQQMVDQAVVCVKCGCAAGAGANFCPNCGQPTVPGAVVCTTCGVALNAPVANAAVNPNAKSKLTAGLLGIFLGAWGVHNFYLGNTGRAIAQIVVTLVTCGVGSLWGLIEGIMILCGSIKTDANGNPLKD